MKKQHLQELLDDAEGYCAILRAFLKLGDLGEEMAYPAAQLCSRASALYDLIERACSEVAPREPPAPEPRQ